MQYQHTSMKMTFQKSGLRISSFFLCVLYIGTAFFSAFYTQLWGVYYTQVCAIHDTLIYKLRERNSSWNSRFDRSFLFVRLNLVGTVLWSVSKWWFAQEKEIKCMDILIIFLDFFILPENVSRNILTGSLQNLLNMAALQFLKHNEFATTEQGTVDLKGRIFCGGPDEYNCPIFNVGQ